MSTMHCWKSFCGKKLVRLDFYETQFPFRPKQDNRHCYLQVKRGHAFKNVYIYSELILRMGYVEMEAQRGHTENPRLQVTQWRTGGLHTDCRAPELGSRTPPGPRPSVGHRAGPSLLRMDMTPGHRGGGRVGSKRFSSLRLVRAGWAPPCHPSLPLPKLGLQSPFPRVSAWRGEACLSPARSVNVRKSCACVCTYVCARVHARTHTHTPLHMCSHARRAQCTRTHGGWVLTWWDGLHVLQPNQPYQ